MRASGTLTVVCVLVGATVAAPLAEATERNARQGQKHARPAQQVAPPVARPAVVPARTAAKPPRPGERHGAASQARTTASGRVMQASARMVVPAHRMPGGSASIIPPQEPARAAAAMPAVLRGAQAAGLGGTPILHVPYTGGLSCVPFARMATGMNISGDARLWWYNAAGVYARGQSPERGSVLAFTASGGMSRGHVAVVSRVVNDRTILIDHSNWGGPGLRRGQVMRGVVVVDVSDRNDWTAVRVQVGHDSDTFGRTYPTHGFIYNRATDGRVLMAAGAGMTEVAEAAPSPHAAQHLRLTSQLFAQ